jgi:hypothetical protein
MTKQLTGVSLTEHGFEANVAGIQRCLAIGGKLHPSVAVAKEKELSFRGGTVRWVERADANYTTVITGVTKLRYLLEGKDRGWVDTALANGDMRQAPLNTPLAVKVGDLAPNARLIGQPVAVKELSINGVTLTPMYCGHIVVLTKELARAGGPDLELFLDKIGRISMATGTDKIVFGSMVDSNTPSTTTSDFPSAVAAAIQAVSVSASSKVYILLSPDAAKLGSSLMGPSGVLFPQLNTSGGFIGAHPAVRTAALEGVSVAAVDVDAIVANVGEMETDVSDEADIIFNDDPQPGMQTVISLFQTNSSGVRLLRKFGAVLTRQDAISIATISGT